jgi:hypothetical protein
VPDETFDRDLSAFARALAASTPHPGRLDRDALLFAAGQAARARRERFWQFSTAVLAFFSVTSGTALVLRPAPVLEPVRVVYLQAPQAPTPQPQLTVPNVPFPSLSEAPRDADATEGMRLRERVLRDGVAALPDPALVWNVPPQQPFSERDVPEFSALRQFSSPSDTGGLFR